MESRRSRGLARFSRQVHALFLKNLSFQVIMNKSLRHALAMQKCHLKETQANQIPASYILSIYSYLLEWEMVASSMPTAARAEEEREDERRDHRVPGAALRAPRLHPARGGQRAGAASVPLRLRRPGSVRHPALHAHPGARLRRARAAEVAGAAAGAGHRGARPHAPPPAPVQGAGELPRHRASHRPEPPACPRYSPSRRLFFEGPAHLCICVRSESSSSLFDLFVLDEISAGLGSLLFPPLPPQYARRMPGSAASNSSDYLDLFSAVVPVGTFTLINRY